MSKFLPPKPIFFKGLFTTKVNESIAHGEDGFFLSERSFHEWYNREIVPLFEGAVEVYGRKNFGGYQATPEPDDTHKAILINIRPIEEESAESILREFVAYHLPDKTLPILQKAKRFLERSDKNSLERKAGK